MAKGYGLPKYRGLNFLPLAGALFTLGAATGCLQSGAAVNTQAVTTNSGIISTASTSDMGVRIYLRNSDPSANYDKASFTKKESSYFSTCATGGNPASLATPCLVEPDIYFTPDGQNTHLQAQPIWLSKVAVGITAAPTSPAACAKFNSYHENDVSVPATAAGTAGESGYYRISEHECTGLTSQNGYDPNESLQIRVELDRTKLAVTENIMMVLEYSAMSVHPELTGNGLGTSNCLVTSGGNPFASASCAVFLWQLFVHGADVSTVTPSPFLSVIPPVSNSILLAASANNGSLIQTRQMIVPLSALSSSNSILQLSRTKANIAGTNFTGCDANSPLCNGVVFYSLTLFRM